MSAVVMWSWRSAVRAVRIDSSSPMSRLISRTRPIHPLNVSRIQSIGLRQSSHTPVYRPPTGYMFNEKVILPVRPELTQHLATEERQETQTRRLGTLYVGLFRNHCVCNCRRCNQTRSFVCIPKKLMANVQH
jgi:hypothetical protein